MSHRHNRLTFLHAPCHGPTLTHSTIRFALSDEFHACAVGFSEAYRHEAFLRGRPRWRPTMPAPRPEDDSHMTRGKFDAPVLVRRHHPLVASWSVKACGRSAPLKLAPPRWFNGQTFAHDLGAVETIAAHPHAKIVGLPGDLDRVEKYAESMRVLEAHIEKSLNKGRLVVLGGDLNYPDRPGGPAWSPPRMLRRLGLKHWAVGIDWVAWSPELVPVRNRVIGREQTHQDHPWLWVSFTGFSR